MSKKILLIADDEEMNRKIISRFLKNEFEIIEAADGRAAWNILQSTHVDALLLDIIMPEMDGLEVLKAMGEDKKLEHIGVLVATSTKEKTERTALSMGADDVVSKPYDPIVIRKRMENILAMKEVATQKKQLLNHEIDEFQEGKQRAMVQKAQAVGEKLNRYADVINANASNIKLVKEIADELKTEAENLTNIFTEAE